MFEDILKSTSDTVKERLASPLIGSFVVAWATINYKFIVILFSDASVTRTFSMIETIAFPSFWWFVGKGVVAPLLVALAYIYIYPEIAHKILEKTLDTKKRANELEKKHLDSEIVTEERLARIRAKHVDQVNDLKKQIESQENEISDLRAALDRTKKPHLQPDDLPTESVVEFSGKNIEETLHDVNYSYPEPKETQDASLDFQKMWSSLSATSISKFKVTKSQVMLIWALAGLGGEATVGALMKSLMADKVALEFDLEALKDTGFLWHSHADQKYHLSQPGRKIALEFRELTGSKPR